MSTQNQQSESDTNMSDKIEDSLKTTTTTTTTTTTQASPGLEKKKKVRFKPTTTANVGEKIVVTNPVPPPAPTFAQHPLRHRFVDRANWQKETKLACRNCGESFLGEPKPLPLHWDSYSRDFTVDPNRIVCSFGCAMRYCLDRSDYQLMDFIKIMAKEHWAIKTTINPSEPLEMLSKFGGPLSIEQYRTRSNKHNPYIATAVARQFPFANSITTFQSHQPTDYLYLVQQTTSTPSNATQPPLSEMNSTTSSTSNIQQQQQGGGKKTTTHMPAKNSLLNWVSK